MNPLAIAYTASPTVTNAETFSVECIASTGALDGENERIRPRGWQLARVEKGQVKLLDSHNARDLFRILGKVDAAAVNERAELRLALSYAVQHNPLAELAWKMTLGGFLTGYSVGFRPLAVASMEDVRSSTGAVILRANRALFKAAAAEMGLSDEEATGTRRIIVQQELVEVSALAVPSNPEAMVRALGAGAIRDEDLHRAGLGGDATRELLEVGAKSWPALTPANRATLSELLGGIALKNLQPAQPTGTSTAEHAQRRAAGEETDHRRAELLQVCKTLSAKLAAETQA